MSAEILIIDDNSDIRLILNELISEEGYKTRLAANYNQALSEIDKKDINYLEKQANNWKKTLVDKNLLIKLKDFNYWKEWKNK